MTTARQVRAGAASRTDVRTPAQSLQAADRFGPTLWTLSGRLTIAAQSSLITTTRDIPASVVLFGNTEAVTIRTVIGNPLVFGGNRADHDLRRAL
ncbi:hypothetical protein ACFQV8_00900 [Pseudonocardia benzenivorans]